MSTFEVTLVGSLTVVFLSILWKWSKSLLLIIFMELITAIFLSLMMISYSSFYLLLIILFVFFVSEALILLSSLYSSLRFSGLVFSSLIL